MAKYNKDKTARLEIRVSDEDKQYLKQKAISVGCTMTTLLQDYIDALIEDLRIQDLQAPRDSGSPS